MRIIVTASRARDSSVHDAILRNLNDDDVILKIDNEEYALSWGDLIDALLALGGEASLGSLQDQLEKLQKQKYY